MNWSRDKSTGLLGRRNDVVPYNTPGNEGNPVPVFRAQAWALQAAHNDGARFTLTSAIRDDAILSQFNREYGTTHSGQQYLYDHQNDPGFYPADAPTRSSHCGWQDGSTYYPHVGRKLNYLQWGIDAVDDGSQNDAAKLVWHMNRVGIRAAKAYPGASSENHHLVIITGGFQCWKALFNQERRLHNKAWSDFEYKERKV